MVKDLEDEGNDDPPPLPRGRSTMEITSSVITSKCFADFIIRGSNKFFRVMDINTDSLGSDPA